MYHYTTMEQNGDNNNPVTDVSTGGVLLETALTSSSSKENTSTSLNALQLSANDCVNYNPCNSPLLNSENSNNESDLYYPSSSGNNRSTTQVRTQTTEMAAVTITESGAEAAMSYKPANAIVKMETSRLCADIESQSMDCVKSSQKIVASPKGKNVTELSLIDGPSGRCERFPDENLSNQLSDSLSQLTLNGISGAEGSTNESQGGPSDFPIQSVYHIKWMQWKGNNTPIITQNENGPCPLIAIMNVLILKGKVHLPPMIEMITSGQLMEYLGDCILEQIPSVSSRNKNISEGVQLNFEQNMHDAMANLPKLQTGLDVNVRFSGVRDFEYTSELIVFDLLNIPLYHGWLVDPESPEIVSAVGTCSYNQLVEKIIINKGSSKPEIVTDALIAENFLEGTASQLTYHGLCELNTSVPQDELAVLFRNNHFSTVYKHENELFLLVTDQGFLTESMVVWETLSNVEGDGQFVDANFCIAPPKPRVPPASLSKEQQIDQDLLVALSLQEEQRQQQEQEAAWQQYKKEELGVEDNFTDEDLARRLQEEENQRAAELAAQQQQQLPGQQASGSQPPVTDGSSSAKKKGDCLIL